MKKLLYILSLFAFSVHAFAQEKNWGRVSASLESTSHVYANDPGNGFVPSENLLQLNDGGIFASNNYLKADYYKGRLSAGLQVEGYFPTTAGYPLAKNMLSLSNLYVSWVDDSYSITAGTFYEQLGSGLLFRSWEDRALGLNNALIGARVTYKFKEFFAVKAFCGIPSMGKISEDEYYMNLRNNFRYPAFGLGLTDVNIGALDFSLSLSDCFDWDDVLLSLEASVMNKYEQLSEYLIQTGFKNENIGWSARANFDVDGFYFRGEHVSAGMQAYQAMTAKNANAQLFEIGYNKKGLGVSVSARRLHSMNQKIYMSSPLGFITLTDYNPTVNVLSYCPALSTQYTYMLANLNPYAPLTDGEAGGQIDAFYNFRRGTKIGGKRGMKVHANFSTYYSLNADGGFSGADRKMWDFSIDVEKQWTKKFKSTLMYSAQDQNIYQTGVVLDDSGNRLEQKLMVGQSHIFVADLLYKWTGSFSTRMELQYLTSNDFQKDWMAALLEVSFAPSWSVYASDMYNHGGSKMHYYNAGISYAYRWVRVAAAYGRYRAGFICSGGVCREVPAYTGASLTLTASF